MERPSRFLAIPLPSTRRSFLGSTPLPWDGSTQRFAVNVPPDESRTDSLSADELEQRQVSLGQPVTRAALADKLRQMRDVELESRQKLWRWVDRRSAGDSDSRDMARRSPDPIDRPTRGDREMNHHHRRLMDELNEVARRYRHLFGWLACTIVWLGSAAAGAILTQADVDVHRSSQLTRPDPGDIRRTRFRYCVLAGNAIHLGSALDCSPHRGGTSRSGNVARDCGRTRASNERGPFRISAGPPLSRRVGTQS